MSHTDRCWTLADWQTTDLVLCFPCVTGRPTGLKHASKNSSSNIFVVKYIEEGKMDLGFSPLFLYHTARKIPFIYSFYWELRGLSLNFHIHMSVRFIYSQDRSAYFPAAEQIAHRHINVEIGTEAAQFLFWECFCFEFSLLFLCSAGPPLNGLEPAAPLTSEAGVVHYLHLS
jgi:hypothetical protein